MLGIGDVCCADLRKTDMFSVEVNVAKTCDVYGKNASGLMISHEYMQWRHNALTLNHALFRAADATSAERERQIAFASSHRIRPVGCTRPAIQVNHFFSLAKTAFSQWKSKRQAV
jgi:hypothetical protein